MGVAGNYMSDLAKPFKWLEAGIRWRAQALSQRMRIVVRTIEVWLRHRVGSDQSQSNLISNSQSYWNGSSERSLEQNSHWRGVGIFADDSRWLGLGLQHLRLYEEFARAVNLRRPLKRIVEWGCGGGVNAVQFGQLADEFCGIDISAASLEECARQMKAVGLSNFVPICIDAADPESALNHVLGPCELLISTYVFELLPTPEYGIRVLRIVHKLLAEGGIAIIQIKYSDGTWKTEPRGWDYAKNLAWNATYRIEQFWQAAQECGFLPRMVALVPQQPLVNDRNYAYFLLQKPIGAQA
jgi:SAM-dependent methyltransferase